MDAVIELCPAIGVEAACKALGVARASFYRLRPPFGPPLTAVLTVVVPRPTPARALCEDERVVVRAVLNSARRLRAGQQAYRRNV
jgi:hypothetical protein